MSISRRKFVYGASALGTAAALPGVGWAQTGNARTANAQTESPQPAATPAPLPAMPPGTPASTALVPPQASTIREMAAARNLLAGCAVNIRALQHDEPYAQLVRQQANILVAENSMKFGPLRPAPNRFFFDEADYLFSFAEANGMKVRGHNFVWHRQLPAWFEGYATAANARETLVQHIETVGGRYAGRVHSWDVVNEAIQVDDGQPGGLRNSPWYKLLGPSYLDLAFTTARRVDPKALLCYNDYDIESEAPAHAAKRAAVLDLVRGMQARGTPLDAIGVQSHIAAGGDHHYGPGLQRFMQQVQGMGLKLLLTEMDVNDRALPANLPGRDATVAATYRDYLNLTLANPDVIALLTWGITDRYTWLNGEDARKDKLPERSLPFDADLRPVLAYPAEVAAIAAAPARP